MLRLLLVEDHAAFRGALKFLLDLRPGMRVVAECGSLAGCRALGDRLRAVDLALLDLVLPDGDGAGLVAVLRGSNPGVRVLVLSANNRPRRARAGGPGGGGRGARQGHTADVDSGRGGTPGGRCGGLKTRALCNGGTKISQY